MTITVDCRMLKASGVGVYLEGNLPFLLKSSNDFLLLGNENLLEPYAKKENVKIVNCKIKPFSVSELIFFPKKIKNQINKTSCYYSPFFNIPGGLTVPVYTTIHDIIFPDMPELTSKLGLFIRMIFFRRCFRLSKKIFTVSLFSKARIDFYSKNKTKTVVTYSAIQTKFLESYAQKPNPDKNKTIVFIGNIKKHKGLDYLLEAFALARQEGLTHKLIIIGSRNNFRTSDKTIQKNIKTLSSDAVFFTGFVSTEQLMNYISTSELLVQPSLYEGFCLPPLEALVLGTNVLISDIPVLKEIYEDFPVTFFRAGDKIDLKNKLLEQLGQKKLQPQLTNNHLSKYTFEKTASIILGELLT